MHNLKILLLARKEGGAWGGAGDGDFELRTYDEHVKELLERRTICWLSESITIDWNNSWRTTKTTYASVDPKRNHLAIPRNTWSCKNTILSYPLALVSVSSDG